MSKYNISCDDWGDRSDAGGWVGMSFETYGDNLEELKENCTIAEVDQEGEEVNCFGIEETTKKEHDAIIAYIKKEIEETENIDE